jgi:histidinol-phosphate aminotransferase
VADLTALGFTVTPRPRASFVLVHTPGADLLRRRLRERGIAVRRGDTFPGLGTDYLRIAVRQAETNAQLVTVLAELL